MVELASAIIDVAPYSCSGFGADGALSHKLARM